jgi:UDP-glucose 4-epimerase
MLADGQEGGVYNLGRSIGCSVSEILSAIFSKAGQTMPPGYYPRRSGDPPALMADPSAAQSVLDFNRSILASNDYTNGMEVAH